MLRAYRLHNFGLTRSHLEADIFDGRGERLHGGGLAVPVLRVSGQQGKCILLLLLVDGGIRMTRWLNLFGRHHFEIGFNNYKYPELRL